LKLGKEVFAPDQRKLAGFGDEEIQLARRLARREPAAAIRRPKLSSPERQDDAGIAKGKRDRVAVAGHHDALAHVPGLNGPVGHSPSILLVISLPEDQQRNVS
jgi:hypothetical protein